MSRKARILIPEVMLKLLENNLNIRWYCIGDGPIQKEIREKAKRLGLEKHLFLLGTKKNPYPFL